MSVNNRHDCVNGNAVFHRQNLYPPDFSAFTYSALTVVLYGIGSGCYPTGQFLNDFLPMRKQITSLAALFTVGAT